MRGGTRESPAPGGHGGPRPGGGHGGGYGGGESAEVSSSTADVEATHATTLAECRSDGDLAVLTYRRQRVLSMLEAKFERKRIDAAAQQVELQAQLKLVEELGKPVRRDQEWAFSSTAPGTLAKALDYLMPIADPQELAGKGNVPSP